VPYRKTNVFTKKLPILANNGRYQREKAHSFINTYVMELSIVTITYMYKNDYDGPLISVLIQI
jgi:hypothetical protein